MIFFYLALTLVLLVVLSILFYFGYSVVRYIPIIERNAFEVPRYQVPKNHTSPGAWKQEDVIIPISRSGVIRGRYVHATNPTRRLIIFCHETGADLNSWQKHIYFLPAAGFDVLTFDFNPGVVINRPAESAMMSFQWPMREELQCLEGALNWIRRHRPGYEIGLFGISKGAVLAAAGSITSDIKAVVMEGAFSTYRTLELYMKRWVKIYLPQEWIHERVPDYVYQILARITVRYATFRKNLGFFSIESYLPLMKMPVFLIHAGQDHYFPKEEAEFIRKSLKTPTEFWLAKEAKHSDSVVAYPKDYERRIKSFFERNLTSLARDRASTPAPDSAGEGTGARPVSAGRTP